MRSGMVSPRVPSAIYPASIRRIVTATLGWMVGVSRA